MEHGADVEVSSVLVCTSSSPVLSQRPIDDSKPGIFHDKGRVFAVIERVCFGDLVCRKGWRLGQI
jgi:hypothetical protein